MLFGIDYYEIRFLVVFGLVFISLVNMLVWFSLFCRWVVFSMFVLFCLVMFFCWILNDRWLVVLLREEVLVRVVMENFFVVDEWFWVRVGFFNNILVWDVVDLV